MPQDYLSQWGYTPKTAPQMPEEDPMEVAARVGTARGLNSIGYAAPRVGLGTDQYPDTLRAPNTRASARPAAVKPFDPLDDPYYKQAAIARKELADSERYAIQRLRDFDKTDGAPLFNTKDPYTGEKIEAPGFPPSARDDRIEAGRANLEKMLGENAGYRAKTPLAPAQERAMKQTRQRILDDLERTTRARVEFDHSTFMPLRDQLMTRSPFSNQPAEPPPPENDYLAPEGNDWVSQRIQTINRERQAAGQKPIAPGSVSAGNFTEPWAPVNKPEAPAEAPTPPPPETPSTDGDFEEWKASLDPKGYDIPQLSAAVTPDFLDRAKEFGRGLLNPILGKTTQEKWARQQQIEAMRRDMPGIANALDQSGSAERARKMSDEGIRGFQPLVGSEAGGTEGVFGTIPTMIDDSGLPSESGVAGVINAANKFSSGMTTPENIGLMAATGGTSMLAKSAAGTALGTLAQAAKVGAIGAFTGYTAASLPEQVRNVYQTVKNPESTAADVADAVTGLGLTTAMAGMLAHGTLAEVKSTVRLLQKQRLAEISGLPPEQIAKMTPQEVHEALQEKINKDTSPLAEANAAIDEQLGRTQPKAEEVTQPVPMDTTLAEEIRSTLEKPEAVDIGPRDETVSTGTGVPTPKEEIILAEQKRLIDEYSAAQKTNEVTQAEVPQQPKVEGETPPITNPAETGSKLVDQSADVPSERTVTGPSPDAAPPAVARENIVREAETLPGLEEPFNLVSEKARETTVPRESILAEGTQGEMFVIQKIVEGKDPIKSADAAQELYGEPRRAADTLERQLETFDSDPANRRNFDKDQRARLKEVVALLRQRAEERLPTVSGEPTPEELQKAVPVPTGKTVRDIDRLSSRARAIDSELLSAKGDARVKLLEERLSVGAEMGHELSQAELVKWQNAQEANITPANEIVRNVVKSRGITSQSEGGFAWEVKQLTENGVKKYLIRKHGASLDRIGQEVAAKMQAEGLIGPDVDTTKHFTEGDTVELIKQAFRDKSVNEPPLTDIPLVKKPRGLIAGTATADWAKEAILKSQGRASAMPIFDPELIAAHAVNLAATLEGGAIKFADWSAKTVKEFGEEIRPHLQKIWDTAQGYLKDGLPEDVRAKAGVKDPAIIGSEPATEAPTRKHIETIRENAPELGIESQPRDVLSRSEAQKRAASAVDQHGESGALERAFTGEGIEPGADTVIITNAEKRILDRFNSAKSPEEKAAALGQFSALSTRAAKRATELGRQVKFHDEVNRWSEQGILDATVEQINAKRNRVLGDRGVKAANDATDAVNNINKQATEQIAQTPDLLSGIKAGKAALDKVGAKLEKGAPDLDSKIRKAMKDVGVKIRDVIRRHYEVADEAGRKLAEKLVQDAGLEPKDATALAEKVQTRFREMTSEAKKKELDRRLAKANSPEERKALRRTTADKLVEASNLGALDGEQYLGMVAKDLKLPQLDPKQATKLQGIAARIQKAPEGFKRNEAITDALTEMRKIEGVGKMDVAASIYYAHILSGYTTQAVNTVSTAINTVADLSALAVTNPSKLGEIIRGSVEGFSTGLKQAGRTLQTGYSDKGLTVKTGGEFTGHGKSVHALPTLEQVSRDPEIAGRPLQYYAKLMRYVGRGMSASDAVFYETNKSAYDYVAAARLAELEASGKLSRSEMNKKIRTILATSPFEFESARAQATREGMKGFEHSLRTAEIMRQKRAGSLGAAHEEAHQFALNATFNEQPRGVLGLAAESVANFSQKVPAVKLFVPFTRIVANVANASLNYSPLGLKRAVKGFTGEAPPGGQERATLMAKGLIGTVGTIGGLVWALNQGDTKKQPLLTGRGPRDANARNQLRETGWIPYSIKISDRYYSYLNTPIALPSAVIGNLADKIHYEQLSSKEVGPAFASALTTIPETLTNMTFLQGLSQIFAISRGEQGAARQLTQSVAGSVVPNLIQQIDRAFDGTIRDTSGTAGLVLGRVPVVRENMFPAQTTARGQPVKTGALDRFTRSVSGDELAGYIAESQNWIPRMTRPQIGPKGKKRPATDEEFRQFQIESGREINAKLQSLLPKLRRLTPEEAKKQIGEVATQAHQDAITNLNKAAAGLGSHRRMN